MKKPPIPSNEKARLASLKALNILDTPPEERFDRLTRLARSIFEMPIAQINFVDQDRVWIKSNVGLGLGEASRDESFCGHTIGAGKLMVVNDAHKDERFHDNPYVLQDPNIRFYAGIPLAAPDKQQVGTLCIIDRKPRELSPGQEAALRDLATLVEHEIGMMDLKAATEQLLFMKRFSDVTQDLLCTANFQGFFTYVHPRMTQELGWSESELMTTPFFDFIHPEDREKTNQELKNLSLGQRTFNFANRYRTKTGNYRSFLWNATAFPEDNILFASARDITARVEIEQLKDQLIGMVSHELRSPLTSILGSLRMITSNALGPVSKDVMDLAELAERSGSRMLRLINDILDIEKIECGKAEFKMTLANLREVVAEAVKSLDAFGMQRNVKIKLAPGNDSLNTLIDSDRIIQVVTNLVSNAVKFAPEGTAVEVSVTKDNKSAHVAIQDHGAGIPDEFRSRIFNKFAQASNRKSGGSGLGLNISKAIVEQHGGSIGYESALGKGSAFFFDLPIV